MESSHVDLDDPTRLDFEYMRWLAGAIEGIPLRERALRVLHLGGGGCTLARYLQATRPDARQVVVELDPEVMELTKQAFGLRSSAALRLRTGEARTAIAAEADDRWDLVVRDAFIGSEVPAHLATVQFVRDVARVLRPEGIYLANLADGDLLALARREAATALQVFSHVAVVAEPAQLHGRRYGNVVIAGSMAPLPLAGWVRRLSCDPVRARLLDHREVRDFASGRAPLDDADLETD